MVEIRKRTPEYGPQDRAGFEALVARADVPFILRGQCADWDMVRIATDRADETCHYLLHFANQKPAQVWVGEPGSGGRFGYAQDFKGFNFERQTASIAQLFATLVQTTANLDIPPVYAGGVPIPENLPGLLPHIPMPLLDEGMERLTSLWIGNGSRTAAHWDLPRNLACVVAGRRRFVLFPPDQIANLYPGPIDLTLAGQPISLVNFEAPDLDAHPRFATALEHAQAAELGPGDTLYLPSLWWHRVETPEPFGAQVNFWWRDSLPHMVTPLFTLFHALLTIRDLPEGERAAWRSFFDYYVFGAGPDPAAHIPQAGRGVLGAMTPELAAQIRAFLGRSLGR